MKSNRFVHRDVKAVAPFFVYQQNPMFRLKLPCRAKIGTWPKELRSRSSTQCWSFKLLVIYVAFNERYDCGMNPCFRLYLHSDLGRKGALCQLPMVELDEVRRRALVETDTHTQWHVQIVKLTSGRLLLHCEGKSI